jgi:hypothetical protein
VIDAVVSCYGTPATAGVAKFNACLAERLGVPSVRLGTKEATFATCPLISLKPVEMPGDPNWRALFPSYSLFLHAWSGNARERRWVEQADTVYAANPQMAEVIKKQTRVDVIAAFCPSTIQGNPTRGTINVLTFGMAGRLQLKYFRKLKALLDAQPLDYTISLSTAVHEGSPWDAVALAGDELRTVFKDKLRCLGFLADDALARELKECTAVALFFDPALRANNTTFWAAVEAGRFIVTNLDALSPIPNGTSAVHDVSSLAAWPGEFYHKQYVVGSPAYTWNALLETMGLSVSV